MAMNISDGFDDDELLLEESLEETQEFNNVIDDEETSLNLELQENNEETNEENDNSEQDNHGDNLESSFNVIAEFLKDNGIEDYTKIQFQNEKGEIEERSWEDLSGLEQLNILRSNQRDIESELDDSEIELLNVLRGNKITVELYNQLIAQLAIKQYLEENPVTPPQPIYTSDQLTDDELFLLDLQSRIEDITDEELQNALNSAKENEELYAKLMKGIRAEYQRLELELHAKEQAILDQKEQDAYIQYSGLILDLIVNLKGIGDLDIQMTQDDMEELNTFILGYDSNGVNYLQQALQDPETLTRAAWFLLHGEDVFNGISQYYNLLIEAARKEGYSKATKKTKKELPTVVHKPTESKKDNIRTFKSVDDLDDLD